MRYCFFGLNPGGMTEYPAGIARELARLDGRASFTFLVDDPSGLVGVEFPENTTFIPRGSPSLSDVRQIVRDVSPDVFVTTAQRIPDSAFVSAAKEVGAFTAMFQHGLYLPFMKREPSLFVQKARKTLDYVRYARGMARMHGRPPLRYVLELIQVFVRGKRYADADVDLRRLNVDLVLLNGEYWRDFHSRQYGYEEDQQVVVGYPDYDQLVDIETAPLQEAVCYIAQTLVEHGRLPAGELARFLAHLGAAVGDRPLILKLHPASDRRLYEGLLERPNVTEALGSLPRCTHYVGHYSTYLALVPFLSQNLVLWSFPGHPIPESVRPAASHVVSEAHDLQHALDDSDFREPTAESLENWGYFFFRPEGATAFQVAADELFSRVHART